jgi:hypothetical protein
VDLIEKAKKTIEKNLTELEEKHSAFVKWRWVATYFNKLIEEHDLVEYKISI